MRKHAATAIVFVLFSAGTVKATNVTFVPISAPAGNDIKVTEIKVKDANGDVIGSRFPNVTIKAGKCITFRVAITSKAVDKVTTKTQNVNIPVDCDSGDIASGTCFTGNCNGASYTVDAGGGCITGNCQTWEVPAISEIGNAVLAITTIAAGAWLFRRSRVAVR
jgi:hypothetical protein